MKKRITNFTKILGVDYGRSKMGLALAEGSLAEPWKVIRVDSFEDALNKIKGEIEKEKIERVVVGVSEREMGEEQKKFAESLNAETFDETLSTKEAQRMGLEAGVKRKKRRGMEDAFAAAIMLQSYLDSYV